MSFFKLSCLVIKAIDQIRRNFLWGGNPQYYRGKNLVKWENVCKDKRAGGLEIIDMHNFNQSLLSKWIWKTLDRESLISKVIFSIYSSNDSNPISNPQERWKPILRRGISEEDKRDITHLLLHIDQVMPSPIMHDSVQWPFNSTNTFTVKSFYSLLNNGGTVSPLHNFIWYSPVPLKVKIFFWILSKKKLQTKDNLHKKGWGGDPSCPFCNQDIEAHDHLFIPCSFSSAVWSIIFPSSNLSHCPKEVSSMISDKDKFLDNLNQRMLWRVLFPCHCWCIWSSPNNLIFNNTLITPLSIVSNADRFTLFWTGAYSSRKAHCLHRAAVEFGLQDMAKANEGEVLGENFA
ncbi:uncharacterized protein LOC109845787 [Asparagus officinalis]|uniref:uncharacterized protein LOC109845787 n=1 Tax=Asparagus officinalis TaxID=4686 RepID=UPI00098DEE28|nr:uncharacterized protein LOC109845787 [Asparagus officinalis]